MEVDLYNKFGQPIAYIAEDQEHSIYLWDGSAVCYIVNGDLVYGWNGKHLGWFEDGILYDLNGYRVGFSREKCPVLTCIPSIKSIKQIKRIKNIRCISHIRSLKYCNLSPITLKDFLEQGR